MRTPKKPPHLKFADTKLLAHMLDASDQENTQLRADLGRRIECEAAVVAERNALHAEIARLRAALEQYADPENWSVGTGWSGGDEWLGNQHRGWSLAQNALDHAH